MRSNSSQREASRRARLLSPTAMKHSRRQRPVPLSEAHDRGTHPPRAGTRRERWPSGKQTSDDPRGRRGHGKPTALGADECHSFAPAGTPSVMNEFRPIDSDVELLRAARTDPDAFGDFYRRHAVAVERWIRAQTRDMATAADLTAETFAQALVSLGRFRGTSDESARGWLYGIARNLVRRYHRRGRVELVTCQKLGIQLDHDPDELAEIESQIDAAIQKPELTQALNTLPDTQRQALQLRVVDEMDYATTAASPAFAVTRLHDGSVSLKINRTASIADINRRLAAMGIERIGRGTTATGHDLSSIPSCSSIPAAVQCG